MSNLPERFWAKVEKTDECWLWTAGLDRDGYGSFRMNNRNWRVHRIAFEDTGQVIPEGLVIDHLCRVRNCVNPDHLEPVTNGENVLRGDTVTAKNARKTVCDSGHDFTPENTGWQSSVTPKRYCKKCESDRNKKRRSYLTAYMREYRKR